MKKLRAGVIGPGVFGAHHARKYQADPRVELVGMFGIDRERAEMLAEDLGVSLFETLDSLIEAVDIVTVSSPPATHASAAGAALEYGRHVFVEKPIAAYVNEAELLIAAAERNKLVLACGHQERLVFEAMGLFDAPARPRRIESVREGPWTGRSADVSVTLDLMVHDFDLAARLMGAHPEKITAIGKAVHGPSADHLVAELGYADANAARFTASRIAETRTRTMRLVYDEGEVFVDFMARTFNNTTPFALNADFAETANGRDPLGANVKRFVDAVLGQATRPAVTGEEARDALALARAADEAAGLPSLTW